MTLDKLAKKLDAGEISSVTLVKQAFARLAESAQDKIFTINLEAAALAKATEIDQQRVAGKPMSRLAGIPITIKDLFDLEGLSTAAGSRVLENAPVAAATAPCIQKLEAAGLIVLGKVNMTEFAYSGLGLNPHHGTPFNPYSTDQELIPGGSSSGSAVSVASGMVAASIGTDTGGSVRIPASFCHLTGFKPGSTRIDKTGVIPLALTLDTVGPLANSVDCCAQLYGLMSDQQLPDIHATSLQGKRILVPENIVWDDAESGVISRTKELLAGCEAAGAKVEYQDVDLLNRVASSGVQGVIAAYESWVWHRELLERSVADYDPRVVVRVLRGKAITEVVYQKALSELAAFRAEFSALMQDYDVIAWPTTACCAPRFADVEHDDDYDRINLLVLRNTALGNVLDAASLSLPMSLSTADGASLLPAGMMLSRPAGDEVRVLEFGMAVEPLLL